MYITVNSLNKETGIPKLNLRRMLAGVKDQIKTGTAKQAGRLYNEDEARKVIQKITKKK